MATREDVADAMARLGPLDEDIVSVLATDDESWLVRYEDCDIALDFDEDSRALSLASPLGRVEAGRSSEVYAALLKYNAIRRETGGIVMAVLPDDRVVQTLGLGDARITAELCATVLGNFVTKARIWRGYITAAAPAQTDRPAAGIDELLSFAIRV